MSFSVPREKFSYANNRKRSRRGSRDSRGATIEGETDDCKRFGYLLQKYCDERLYKCFPWIHYYMIKDDGELVSIDHLSGLKKSMEILDTLTIYAYSNTDMKLKNLVCMSMQIIDTRMLFAMCETFSHFSNLTSLMLDYCHLTDEHIPILQDNLNTKKARITELSLSGNPIKKQPFHCLINCGLKVLVLRFCEINVKGLVKMAREFLNVPTPLKTLIHLDLSHNRIFDEGCKYVASILRCDRTLHSINLTDCKIRDEGFQELMKTFSKFALDEAEIAFRRKTRFEYFKAQQEMGTGDQTSIERQRNVGQAIPEDGLVLNAQILDNHPITIESYQENGEIFCNGNYSLEVLNLAYNHLTKSSLDLLLKTLMEQSLTFGIEKGIKRVVLEGNSSNNPECATLKDTIQELLGNKKLRYRASSETLIRQARKSSVKSGVFGSVQSNVNSFNNQ